MCMQGVKLRINETGLNCIPIAKRTDTSVVIRKFLTEFIPKKDLHFCKPLACLAPRVGLEPTT